MATAVVFTQERLFTGRVRQSCIKPSWVGSKTARRDATGERPFCSLPMKHEIVDEGDARYYWTQIPNIVFTLGLNPFELSLYCHLKRAAGARTNGKCTKSRATLAKECCMGSGSVSRARAKLEEPRSGLGGQPLIKVREIPNPRGGKAFLEISITDIWKANMSHFAPTSAVDIASSQRPEVPDPTSRATSPVDIKKNSKEKQEEEDALAKYKSDPLYAHVNVEREFEKAQRWAAANNRQVTPRFFVNWLNKIDAPFRPNGNGRTYVDDEWDKALTMEQLKAMVEA